MQRNLHDFVQVGIVHFMAYPNAKERNTYVKTISTIANDPFFQAIEIAAPPDPQAERDVKKLLDDSRMSIGYSAHPALLSTQANLNSLDTSERKKAVQLFKEEIDRATVLEAVNVGFLSGVDPDPKHRPDVLKALTESIQEACLYAKSQGNIDLVLELFDHKTTFRRLIGPSELAVQVAKEIRREDDTFGILVDLAHLPMLEETIDQTLETAKDYLMHVHIGNCIIRDQNHPQYGDRHPRFGVIGSEIDIPEVAAFLQKLFDIGYLEEGKKPVVAFEIKPAEGEDSLDLIEHSKVVLEKAWRQVNLPKE